MPEFDFFSCFIEVDGERLPEYKDPEDVTPDGELLEDDAKVVKRWIPADAGNVSVIVKSKSESKCVKGVNYEF